VKWSRWPIGCADPIVPRMPAYERPELDPPTEELHTSPADSSSTYPTPVAPSLRGAEDVVLPMPPPLPREEGYVRIAESVARSLQLLLADAACLPGVRLEPELDRRLRLALEESKLMLQALHGRMNG
jgi:hypothetical protein